MKKLSLLFTFTIVLFYTSCVSATPQQNSELNNGFTPYKLYPTTNMWTFIKLDTRNGKMWQVQFSIKGDDYRFETPLNTKELITNGNKSGRFELYPTQNMYNFILLDCINGKTWQVQWSSDLENRTIIPIQQLGTDLTL